MSSAASPGFHGILSSVEERTRRVHKWKAAQVQRFISLLAQPRPECSAAAPIASEVAACFPPLLSRPLPFPLNGEFLSFAAASPSLITLLRSMRYGGGIIPSLAQMLQPTEAEAMTLKRYLSILFGAPAAAAEHMGAEQQFVDVPLREVEAAAEAAAGASAAARASKSQANGAAAAASADSCSSLVKSLKSAGSLSIFSSPEERQQCVQKWNGAQAKRFIQLLTQRRADCSEAEPISPAVAAAFTSSHAKATPVTFPLSGKLLALAAMSETLLTLLRTLVHGPNVHLQQKPPSGEELLQLSEDELARAQRYLRILFGLPAVGKVGAEKQFVDAALCEVEAAATEVRAAASATAPASKSGAGSRASAASSTAVSVARGPFLVTDVMERGCGGPQVFDDETALRAAMAEIMNEHLAEDGEEEEEEEENEDESIQEEDEVTSFTAAQVERVLSGTTTLESAVQRILDFQGGVADHSRSGSAWLTVAEIVQPTASGQRATFRLIGNQRC